TVKQQDGGYYNEFLDFHDAVTAGTTPVGTIEQSFRNMELILLGLESAREGVVLRPDPAVGPLLAQAVPLWIPRGADGPVDGLDVEIARQYRVSRTLGTRPAHRSAGLKARCTRRTCVVGATPNPSE
ncbi:MAG: hypothetical protein ACTHQE_04005, partial [Thermomicrobiales bacterium]